MIKFKNILKKVYFIVISIPVGVLILLVVELVSLIKSLIKTLKSWKFGKRRYM